LEQITAGERVVFKEKFSRYANIFSALFLVAGTCIGGGMLALPITAGISGFFPSVVVMLICWMAMTATALMLLEVTLWMEEGVHVITMSSRLLGLPGKAVSWCLYLFICYASIIAYTAGGGEQISAAINSHFDYSLSKEIGCVIFVLVFGSGLYFGSSVVGRINAILFIAMIASYVFLVGLGSTEVKPQLLMHQQWSSVFLALPVLLTSFSFQTMVPSLTPYLKAHVASLRLAIVGGTFLAFVIYAIWQALILGIVPVQGTHGLADALARGEPVTQFLSEHIQGKWLPYATQYFAFFALVTSFLGISLGLYDFLADGLKIKKQGFGKILLGLLIGIPTLIFAIKFKRIFILALDATGGYGDTILNGLIPVLMIWVGRYKLGYRQAIQLPGGKPILVLIFAFFSSVLILEILSHAGFITSIYDIYDEMAEFNIPELKEE
jgi:tyrosine-specific transport protein